MLIPSHQILDTFAVLSPELAVHPVALSPTFYQELDRDFAGFAGHVLISVHEFTEPWSTWERHPAGDEIVMLLSGQATLMLRIDDSDVSVSVNEPGAYVVVPKNTWHTALVSVRTRMLFITPGQGTENISAEAMTGNRDRKD